MSVSRICCRTRGEVLGWKEQEEALCSLPSPAARGTTTAVSLSKGNRDGGLMSVWTQRTYCDNSSSLKKSAATPEQGNYSNGKLFPPFSGAISVLSLVVSLTNCRTFGGDNIEISIYPSWEMEEERTLYQKRYTKPILSLALSSFRSSEISICSNIPP